MGACITLSRSTTTFRYVSMGFSLFFFLSVCLALFGEWWQLQFTDCSSTSIDAVPNAYYFLYLNRGICYGTSNKPNDAITCQKWYDFSDDDTSSVVSAANDMQAATGLIGTIFALVVVLNLLNVGNIAMKNTDQEFRITQIVVYGLIFILLASMWGITNNNWFYDTDNYGPDLYCEHNSTYGTVGYVFAVLMTLLSIPFSVYTIYPVGLIEIGDDDNTAALNTAQSSIESGNQA